MQFYYQERKPLQPKEGDTDIKWETLIHSFDMDRVIRTYEFQKDQIVVLLDDGHEETRDVPVQNKKGETVNWEKKRQFMQSEIYLNVKDTLRYREATGYNAGDFMSSTLVSGEPENMGDTQPEIPFPVEAE